MYRSIAIDGPAGAGKSTVARALAQKLQLIYVDTGAMYRVLALYCHDSGIDIKDTAEVIKNVYKPSIRLENSDKGQQIFLDGEDVTDLIRTNDIGNDASVVSTYPEVRKRLVEMQQEIAAHHDVVMDGRDIGTVVMPDAYLKIFLTADPRERAKRRVGELAAKGIEADIDEVEKEIKERDSRDANREVSPLRQADDAVLVDTTDMNVDEVVETIIGIYRERL